MNKWDYLQKGRVVDWSEFTLKELFRIRDCYYLLNQYGLIEEDTLLSVAKELERRARCMI